MKRSDIPLALGLTLSAAIFAWQPGSAGEAPPPRPAPGPGLEIFDGAAPAPEPQRGDGDMLADPFAEPPVTQPPYQPPTLARPQPPQPTPPPQPEEPFVQDPGMYTGSEPYAGPYDPSADPFSGLDEPAATTRVQPMQDPYGQPYQEPYQAPYPDQAAPPQQAPANAAGTPDPYAMPIAIVPVLENLNTRNPIFPGLGEAASRGDLQGAGSGIWEVLRQRRIVDAAMAHGVRGSVGVASPYEMQRIAEIANQNPGFPEDPLAPAYRVNAILDSFRNPVIDDYGYASYMPQILIRLNEDVQYVRYYMTLSHDDGEFLELARTYIRAATTCDFLAFSRQRLTADVRYIMNRGGVMFFPDGSSMGGDTAGITGNLFHVLLMMDYYTRNDSGFRRDLGTMWKNLETPSRYLQQIAFPDKTLPRYGARGTRELTPGEMVNLAALFPKEPPRVYRIGLAATSSFPYTSTQKSYGGVYVSRENDTPGSRSLAIRFGPWSAIRGVPTHNDFGSIELMSRGIKYMVDAGGYGGNAAAGPAHGGLSLNGNHAMESTFSEPGVLADAVWRTNASIDYATAMAGFDDGKTWQRSMLYVKSLPGETRTDYWLVLDNVDMKNDPQPQDARIRFQLAPGITAYQEGSGIFASTGAVDSGIRVFAVDAGARLEVTDGNWGNAPGQVFDAGGGTLGAPSISISRSMVGDSSAATIIYPVDTYGHRPTRIERDSDIIRGRTGAIVIDHGLDRIDVIAWAPPGNELVTPTLNLQLSADLAVFRVRRGKIARIDFINLERFQAKEPDGGLWSMRVNGPAQSLTIEPESGGGWQVLADGANAGNADLIDVNFGPTLSRRKFSIKPGELKVLTR